MKKQPFEEENHLHQNLHFWVQNLHFPGWTWMGMNKKTATWWMKSLLGGSSHLVGTHGKGTYILTMVAITSYYCKWDDPPSNRRTSTITTFFVGAKRLKMCFMHQCQTILRDRHRPCKGQTSDAIPTVT